MRACIIAACVALSLAAPQWTIVDSDIATVDTGLAFISDTTGYSGGAANGVGPQIFKTTNGGVNWTPCPAQFGLDLLLLDTDAAANSIVVSSIFGELYSDNAGTSFQPSTGGGTSQSVRYLGVNGDGGLKYGVTGTYGLTQVNGVGISVDGGQTFKAYDAKLTTDARYGAFPTDTQWYVAAGSWPGEGSDDDTNPTTTTTAKGWRYDGKSYARYKKSLLPTRPEASPAPTGSYEAQITTTVDGGATFKTVFNVTGQYYFNAIDCQPTNPNACCAVAEADSDSPANGARIECTQNGGATWTTAFFQAGTASSGYSLMEIRYATDDIVFACGGLMGALYPSAWFLSSTDGGTTWTQTTPSTMAGWYAIGLSVVDSTHAFAAMLNAITQESAIAAYA